MFHLNHAGYTSLILANHYLSWYNQVVKIYHSLSVWRCYLINRRTKEANIELSYVDYAATANESSLAAVTLANLFAFNVLQCLTCY